MGTSTKMMMILSTSHLGNHSEGVLNVVEPVLNGGVQNVVKTCPEYYNLLIRKMKMGGYGNEKSGYYCKNGRWPSCHRVQRTATSGLTWKDHT